MYALPSGDPTNRSGECGVKPLCSQGCGEGVIVSRLQYNTGWVDPVPSGGKRGLVNLDVQRIES